MKAPSSADERALCPADEKTDVFPVKREVSNLLDIKRRETARWNINKL